MPSVLSKINLALVERLKTGLNKAGLSDNVVDTDPSEGSGNRVSLWMYQVQLDEYSRNVEPPVMREQSATRSRLTAVAPPMGVNLYYLLTPMLGSPQADHEALGSLMLNLHVNPFVSVQNTDLGVSESVRISLLHDTLEERVRLWESLSKPYHLSVTYIVRTARLFADATVTEHVVANFAGVAGGDAASGRN